VDWSRSQVIDVLGRRGALELFDALTGPALSERQLVHARGTVTESVWLQRLAELRALDIIEEVRETGELRLSSRGRRVQGILGQLDAL
jgi:hypothetical protein